MQQDPKPRKMKKVKAVAKQDDLSSGPEETARPKRGRPTKEASQKKVRAQAENLKKAISASMLKMPFAAWRAEYPQDEIWDFMLLTDAEAKEASEIGRTCFEIWYDEFELKWVSLFFVGLTVATMVIPRARLANTMAEAVLEEKRRAKHRNTDSREEGDRKDDARKEKSR